jgi:hypothetical protein
MKTNKTVFIEYSTSRKGQHFMTIVQVYNGKRVIIGRMFRTYDEGEKKTIYRATDWAGTPIFTDIKDLSTLKKKYIECGVQLAQIVPNIPTHKEHDDAYSYPESKGKKTKEKKSSREKEIKDVRQKNTVPNEKEQETRKENSQENEQDIRQEDYQENETSSDDKSDREKEVDQIRENDEDREQDIDR